MKIRTDFVTNSSSSSFVLEICIELKDGKGLMFKANGGTDEVGIIDYFWSDATVTVSPKQLGTAKSVQELIELLKNGVYDGWVSQNDKLFENASNDGRKRRQNPTHFVSMIEEYVKSMDDISQIIITGNEDGSGWDPLHYHRTFSYSPQTGEYVCSIDGFDFEKDGSSGGDLIFEDADQAQLVPHITHGKDVITARSYGIQKTKEIERKLQEASASGSASIMLGVVGSAGRLSGQYAREISSAPDNITFRGKTFVHTSCSNEEIIDKFVVAKGGEVRSSTVQKTDYLIIGNNIDHKTAKITRAEELNAKGKTIEAMTECEFWTLAANCKDEEVFLPKKKTKVEKKAMPAKELTGVAALKKLWSFWQLGDGTLEIIGYNGEETEIVIPEKIGKKTVSRIRGECFSAAKSGIKKTQKQVLEKISSVIIPDSVTNIGQEAFRGCKGLADKNGFVVIRGVLHDCFSEEQAITIPDGVTYIGDNAFAGCKSLTSITIPESVTGIGFRAFSDCKNLTSITILSAVIRFGGYVFKNCSKLSSITIPNGTTVIDDYAFAGCNGLTSVTIPSGVTRIDKSAFSFCNKLNSITIPDSVTSIGERAFEHCSALSSITIPDSVTSIGENAFGYCNKLSSITIPDSVTYIGNRMFAGCNRLTSITIPSSVTSIGSDAFIDCNSLSSITIPNSVTSIGENAFRDCSSLSSIIIPDGVTTIGKSTFQKCYKLISATIPDSVVSIGEDAFYYCSNLSSITIPDSVTSIGKSAFSACKELTIRATAGSCAEAYAKENNIPFVAE